MSGVTLERRCQTSFAEYEALHRRIVAQHGEYGFRIETDFCERSGDSRAFLGESIGFAAGPIIDGNLMARAEQAADHGGPHLSESNESDLHGYRLALLDRSTMVKPWPVKFPGI
jgi:hypothetical protein